MSIEYIINIINNFDQKILMENMLITNQYKLLNMCKSIFESESYKEKKLSVEETKDFIDRQDFINWKLFIKLINLQSEFVDPYNKTKSNSNSMEYLIRTNSHELLEFLLDPELNSNKNLVNFVNWEKQFTNTTNLVLMFKFFCQNDNVINQIIDLAIKNNYTDLFKKQNKNNKSSLDLVITKCSESVILRLLELNLIQTNWLDSYSNSLVHWACKRNLNKLFGWFVDEDNKHSISFDQQNNGGRTPLHIACINNNIDFVKILLDNNVRFELKDNESNYPLNYAIKYGSAELIKLLSDQYLNIMLANSDIFYQIIWHHDENTVKYFIDNNIFNMDGTSLVWTTLLCVYKKYYRQMYSYGSKKILAMLYNIIYEYHNTYNGHYIGDMFYEKTNSHT